MKRFWMCLLFRKKKQHGEVQMSRSEISLTDLSDLQTVIRKTEFTSERGKNFPIALCNQLYSMLDIQLIKEARLQVTSAKFDWFFKVCKIYRPLFSLPDVSTLTANYSEVLQIEPLGQSTVNLLFLTRSTRIID